MLRRYHAVIAASTVLSFTVLAPCQTPAVGIRRNTAAVGPTEGFHTTVDAGVSPPVDDPSAGGTVHVGSTGSLAGEHGPNVALRAAPSDPPPGVNMSTPIGPSDVPVIFHTQEARVRGCVESARAAHPGLAGRVVLHFVIGRDGAVSQPSATGIPEAPEVATCMTQELARLRFPPPATGTLPFTFQMTFAPLPPEHPAHGRGHPAHAPAAPHGH